MKKYLFGLFAIALAIGFSAFTPTSKVKSKGTVYANWYPVNSNLRTSSATPTFTNVDETAIIDGTCDDSGSSVCFAGSDNSEALNTLISTFATTEDAKVKKP